MGKEVEILVIGAGPAGLSAAIEAAKYGAEVLVVDVAKPFHREGREHLRHGDHPRRLADDASQATMLIVIVASTDRRDGVVGEAQRVESGRVGPDGMSVARIHHYRTIGEGRIE